MTVKRIAGTAAAAAGGTTTVVDYAQHAPGATLAQTLEDWKAKAATRAVLDYGFHIALSEISENVLNQIPMMVDAGVTSFKVSPRRAFNSVRAIGETQLTSPRKLSASSIPKIVIVRSAPCASA